jgi:hypothetical protein
MGLLQLDVFRTFHMPRKRWAENSGRSSIPDPIALVTAAPEARGR